MSVGAVAGASRGLRVWGRVVAGAQLTFLGLLVGGLAPLYAYAEGMAGKHEALVAPATVVPAVLAWLFPFIATATLLGPGLGVLLGVAGVALATLTDLRHQRRLSRVLLIASVLCAMATLVFVTPFGEDVQRWFLR